MAGRIARLLGSLRRRGLSGTVEAVVWKARLAFKANRSVTAYRMREKDFRPAPAMPGHWRIEAAPDTTGEAPSFRTCYRLYIDNDVAGRGFAERPEDGCWHIGETGTTAKVPPGSLLLTGFTTHREFRRQGVYVALMSHILAEFFADGGSEAYIGSLTLNTPSRRAIEKVGFSAFTVHRPA